MTVHLRPTRPADSAPLAGSTAKKISPPPPPSRAAKTAETKVVDELHIDVPGPRVPVRPGELLSVALAQSATLPPKTISELRDLLSLEEPLTPSLLTGNPRAAMLALLPADLAGVVAVTPRLGLGVEIFDLRRLRSATAPAVQALREYLAADFVRRPAAEKAEVLKALGPLVVADARQRLREYHLPRFFLGDSARGPITTSLESEGGIGRHVGILDYFAPSADGSLDPRALSPELLARMLDSSTQPPLLARDGAFGTAFVRLSHEGKVAALRWRDLSPAGRLNYLLIFQARIDPKVPLFRIADPKQTGTGECAPESLADKLKWELSGPMKTWELTTRSFYDSEDQLWADATFLKRVKNGEGGFHVHNVVELGGAEGIQALGPSLVGYFGLEDIHLFASGVAAGYDLLDHLHLQPFEASTLADLSKALGQGDKLDLDDFLISKLRCVGIRCGLYGDEGEKLGAEIRASGNKLPATVRRVRDVLAAGQFRDVPPPPWPGWNAGEKGLIEAAWDAAKTDPKLAPLVTGPQAIPFSELFTMAVSGARGKDTGRLASPLWAFEALPNFPADQKANVAQARQKFLERLSVASNRLGKARASGRELPSDDVKKYVFASVREFFQESFLTFSLEQILDDVCDRTNGAALSGSAHTLSELGS